MKTAKNVPIQMNKEEVSKKAVIFISFILVLYILVTKLRYPPEPFLDHSIYILSCTLILFFTKFPKYKGIRKALLVLGTLCALIGVIYVVISVQRIYENYLIANDQMDFYFFLVYFIGAIILLYDNQGGRIISFLAIFAVGYLFIGRYLPGIFSCPAFNLRQIATMVYISYDQGVFGSFISIISRILSIFFMFSSLLVVTGLGDWIRSISMLIAGKTKGGPAKVAVIASALFGMLSGSTMSNVAATGSFTIPLMKRIGYKPKTAAAIETIASTGGGITPPIMALSAFLMSEILGVPYVQVIIWAIVPAFLWYYTTFLYVHVTAITQDVEIWSPPREELLETFKETAHLIIPILILIGSLLYLRVAETAALYSVISLFILSFLRKRTRLNIEKTKIFLTNFTKTLATICILNTILGVFVGAILSTGTHTKLIALVIGGITNWLLVAVIIFVLCVLLGMLVPPFVSYITVVLIAVPALSRMGFNPPAIHMFVLYCCALAPITPPVAMGAFTAAAIADSDAMETAKEATIKSLFLWIIPFILFRYEIFLGINTDLNLILKWIVFLMLATLLFTFGINRYCFGKISSCWALFLIVNALLIVQPVNEWLSILSVVTGLGIMFLLYINRKKNKEKI
jgi:TRAP transporter 4TM/12TM fusion protein